MRVRFLGTGTSTGVPEIGCQCDVCRSTDKRNNRLRASVIVYIEGKSILIDCGPDFRQQMLGINFLPIDALLITHEHYDHVGGIDDLRPFCKFGDIEIYLEQYVSEALKSRIPYCFTEEKYPGIPIIALNEISLKPFFVAGGIEVIPIKLMHGTLPIVGYRIGNFAYLTDLKFIPEEEYDKLEGLDVLVINALRIREHVSHQNLDQALEKIKRIAPRKTYLTHMNHHFGLHAEMAKILPENVFLSFDGLELDIL
ncbi:phosphoribosyl 1,2-cyclic phosphate phosphodiesterase [Dysgonomonas alginatilytica]|uniref:Phosphoribosyl 1,2-cyclic phosphate phosphodiesterase n=1 Tax=Dysgonomonas alginatilytica TaxID=1605892 RepID=A0A2V3PR34_9BACT|nr:MBL fold metallo-hydrolase [Dysgonomonas alginatilytica]PXV63853.1 phosphoribosyl 1,2-cyclic phosphate phosphodiesterase [Dysgonomonas alginatilytica]